MSENTKKKLLFIKAPSHNLKSIEIFLGKRNFEVHTESEIKEALVKAIELQPDFIFIAWDHPNPKITQLPTLIAKATLATLAPVAAYIMSNTKESSRKLNISPVSHKLYPPISAPAIERLILKSSKNSAKEEQKLSHIKANSQNQKNLAEVRKNLLANLDSEHVEIANESSDIEAEKAQEINEQINRNKSIDEKNSILKGSAKGNLSPEMINELKNSFQTQVKTPFEDLLENLALANASNEEEATFNEVIIQQGLENPEGLGNVIQKGIGMGPSLGVAIQKNTSELGDTIQKDIASPNSLGLAIEDKPKSHMKFKSVQALLKAYCMSVYSDNWCGYLVVTSNTPLDFSSIDMVFTEWIKPQFNNLQEIDENDFFEFKFVDQDFIDHLGPKADFHENVKIKDHSLNVFLFPIEPNKMTLELNDEKNLIQVLTEEIPSDEKLNFSLYLHLPENKKYLIYTQANKALSLDQKKRLISNRVLLLYTPIDFEKEYKKFIAEENVKKIYQKMKKLSVS
jgi:hypothetical protein